MRTVWTEDTPSLDSYLRDILPVEVIPAIHSCYTEGTVERHQQGVDIHNECQLGSVVICQPISLRRLDANTWLQTFDATHIVFDSHAPGLGEHSLAPDTLAAAIGHLQLAADIVDSLIEAEQYYEEPHHQLVQVQSKELRHDPGTSAHAQVGDIDG